MKYFKVKVGNIYDNKSEYTTIENELCTLRERKNMYPSLPDRVFEKVSMPSSHTHFLFGARFED